MIYIRRRLICTRCYGTGESDPRGHYDPEDTEVCQTCQGTGVVMGSIPLHKDPQPDSYAVVFSNKRVRLNRRYARWVRAYRRARAKGMKPDEARQVADEAMWKGMEPLPF